MIERLYTVDTLPQAYHHALVALHRGGQIVDCPGYNTRCKEITVTFEIWHPLKEPMISRLIPCGPEALQEYTMEMLLGIKDFCVGKGWAYTYHKRMTECVGADGVLTDQVRFVINELRNAPTSRRAVIDVRNNGDDMYSEDPACLQNIQYFIRPTPKYPNGQLDCKVLFRSNDAVKACYMNMFALVMLQKRIAKELGVPVGTYTHRANSFHAYERDWDLLEKYAEDISGHRRELTYYYEDDWKEQMENSIPDIMEKVEEMRGNIR